MTARRLEIFVIVSIIAVIGIIYAFQQKPLPQPVPTTAVTVNQQGAPMISTSINPAAGQSTKENSSVPTTTIIYPGVDGQTALALLQAGHQVEVQHYSFGDEVISIDGIKPDAQHFWAMYVNGNFSQVGASSYVTKSTDTISWEVDAVADTTK